MKYPVDDVVKAVFAVTLLACAIGAAVYGRWDLVGMVVSGILGYLAPKPQADQTSAQQ